MTRPVVVPNITEVAQLAKPAKDVEVALVSSGIEKDRFVRLPFELYQDDPFWVPPLIMERHEFLDPAHNPFFRHAEVALFLARREGKLVGRIAAVEDRNYNAFHGCKAAYFGLFECIDDPGVAAALVAAARNWGRWRGLQQLHRPDEPLDEPGVRSSRRGLRFVALRDDAVQPALLRANCWSPAVSGRPRTSTPSSVRPGSRRPSGSSGWRTRSGRTRGSPVRPLDITHFEAEVARIKTVYNSAWEKNWGFVPMTDAEFDKLAKDLKQLVVPELALIAEAHGEPIAFSLTVPDINQAFKKVGGRLTTFGLPVGLAKLLWFQKRITKVRLMALGIKEGWRRRGLDAVLIVETIRRADQAGYEGGEVSWTLEDNTLINRAIEASGARRSKVYRLYEMPVE